MSGEQRRRVSRYSQEIQPGAYETPVNFRRHHRHHISSSTSCLEMAGDTHRWGLISDKYVWLVSIMKDFLVNRGITDFCIIGRGDTGNISIFPCISSKCAKVGYASIHIEIAPLVVKQTKPRWYFPDSRWRIGCCFCGHLHVT